MKKVFAGLLALLLLCQVGCAAELPTDTSTAETTAPAESSVPTETTTTEENDTPRMRIGLIHDAAIADEAGYSDAVWNAVTAFSGENGLDCAEYRAAGESMIERMEAMETAIAEGCNVLVLPGFLFGEAIYELQDAYPEVIFLGLDIGEMELWDYGTDCAVIRDNVCCVTFEEAEIGYLAGYAAVAEGYTKLGFAAQAGTPDIYRLGYGFLQGADDAAAEFSKEVSVTTCFSTDSECDDIASLYQQWSDAGIALLLTKPNLLLEQDQMQVILYDTLRSDASGVIAFAEKGYAAAAKLLLERCLSDSLEPYCGKVTNLTLAEGEYLGFDTEHWGFTTFTPEMYRTVVRELADGTRTVSNDTENAPEVAISVVDFR